MTHPTAPLPPSGLPLPDSARIALEQGRKLEAIRLVREAGGLGLKEAKDLVESYVAGQPHLQGKFAADVNVTARGCLLFLLALAGVLLAAFLLLRGGR